MKIVIMITMLFLTTNSLLAQENIWYLTLSNGDTISSISLQSLVGDSLVISHLGETNWIPVESIVEMRKVGKSKFRKGIGIGFVAGAAIGALIGLATYGKPSSDGSFFEEGSTIDLGPGVNALAGGIIGGLAGFVVGGIIGSSYSGKDEIYDLSQKKHEQKLEMIRLLVSK